MPDALVSVVIPTFNRSDLLPTSVRSVFAQDWRPLEIVIVNDGSTDNTPQTIRQLEREAEAAGVRLVALTQTNGGVAKARNAGAEAATGEYVAWLDDDDTWTPTKTGKQLARMRETSASACCAYLLMQTPQGDERHPREGKRLLNGHDGPAFVRGESYAHINSVMFARRHWQETGGFDPDLRWSEDVEWLARLAFVAEFCCVEEILGTYTYNPKGISRTETLDKLVEHDKHRTDSLIKIRERCERHDDWDESAWSFRLAADFDQWVKHLLYAGRLADARQCWLDGMRRTGGHPKLKRTKRKLRKARWLALVGKRLKHPKFGNSEVRG